MITRKSLQQNFSKLKQSAVQQIEAAPLPAFFCGVILGILIALLRGYIYPIVVLSCVAYGGLWLFVDEGPREPHQPQPDPPMPPGKATSSRQAPDQAS